MRRYDIWKGKEMKKSAFAKKLPENALTAYKKPYKGVCKWCSVRGHKEGEYGASGNNNNAPQGKKFDGQCCHCEKYGHEKAHCYQLQEKGLLAIENNHN
jgi:hypothetical protein